MVDGGPEGPPPVKRKRGRPRKADLLAAAAAAAAADGSIVSTVNGVPPPVPIVPGVPVLKPEPKPRKSRKKKGEVSGPVGVDMNLVGKTVTGVLDGSFDAGYLLTVRVGDSETVLRGLVFGPGLTVPISKINDVAPGVKVVKRDESMALPASSPISVLGTPGATQALTFPSQTSTAPLVPATTAYQVTPTTATKAALPSPAGSSLPAAVLTDSNSQGTRGQDSVQPYPVPAPQAPGTAAP